MPTPSHSTEPGVALVSAIPETCPPGEGMFCVDRTTFAPQRSRVQPLGRTVIGYLVEHRGRRSERINKLVSHYGES